jgi:diguanylate cyclase (GGDEF)-like protein/PAS domain S-box-containing protein
MQQNAISPDNAELADLIDSVRGGRDSTQSVIDMLLELAAQPGTTAVARKTLVEAINTLRGQENAALVLATRHRAFLEAIPDAVTLHDEHGDVLDANAAACRLYGHPRSALLTLNLHDLSPALPPDHARHVIESCQSDKTFTIETTIRRGDGRDFPVEVHSSVYLDGNEQRVLNIARGIGHWQRTANALRDAEQRYRIMLHSMDKGVVVRDSGGRIVYGNPAAYRMFEVSESQMGHLEREGFPDWRYFDASGNAIAQRDLPSMRALRSGQAIESELICFWLPHLTHPLWLAATAVPLFRGDGDQPYQVVSTFTDVTELKRTRDLLEQTQAIGHIGGYELILASDELQWTQEMYRLFDLRGDVPITLDRAMALLEPRSRERAQLDLADIRKGAAGPYEYEIVTALGRRRWISLESRPIRRGDTIYSITGMCHDITARKLLERELRRKAVTDPVTGLPNRENILEELNRQILATRDRVGPVLLYVDLDRFKVINDILGAAAGDRLLAGAARRLQDCLPENAHCGRFAGDEFLVVLPRSVREAEPGEIAETINARFRRPFEYGGEEFVITASVGIARFPEGGTTVQQLLHHADAAMSEAKHRGRSTWQAFSHSIARRLENNVAIESQLHHALANRELRLVYQPQVELERGRVVAVEALLRWDHPQRGELHPLAFVQHAESSGDIVAIGAWVIDEACRQLREWRDIGLPLERIAVNVSYRQLLSESFLDTVLSSLRRYDLPGTSLELEMIERMLIEDTPDTVQMFKELRDAGVTITIDDFGEGYSALNYLRRLPVDGFKISYDFMRRIPASTADTAICEAIIRVGHGLGLSMVAEGVETEEQRHFLLQHGMRLGQGHLFSPALRTEAVGGFVRSRQAAAAD